MTCRWNRVAIAVAGLALSAGAVGQTPVEQARELLGQGRFGEAITKLRDGLDAAPADAAVHNMLGAILNRDGRYREALIHARRAAELEPANPRYRYNRGIVLAEHGRFDEALADFDFAITALPDQAPMYLERGAALLALGEDARARADWASARRLDPRLVWSDWYEGLQDLVDGKHETALAKLQSVAAAQPGFANARSWIAIARLRAGQGLQPATVADPWVSALLDFHAGRRSFGDLLAIARSDQVTGDPRRVGEAWLHRAVSAQSAGRRDEAVAAYREALAVPAPRHAWKLLAERELQRLVGAE